MANTAVQTRTNGEFIEAIFSVASEASDAKILLSDFTGFKAWLQLPTTSESIESIAEVFSARIFPSLKSLRSFSDLHREKLKNVRGFLHAMRRLALSDFGVEINIDEADSILDQI
jgi:hypothetical protein